MRGDITISIDYEKFEKDGVWDGLKGYVTNTTLSKNKVIENYRQLWHVEKAFHISKTDLRIRPVYHSIKRRIEAYLLFVVSLIFSHGANLGPGKSIYKTGLVGWIPALHKTGRKAKNLEIY